MSIHVCSFSGSVARLSRRQKKDSMLVLRTLVNDPRVSVWDMDQHGLWKTINALIEKRLLRDETAKEAYPWRRFAVTRAGRRALRETHA